MPQVFLNQAQMDAGFQKMRGIGMPQGLAVNPFLQSRFPDDQPQDILHRLKRASDAGRKTSGFLPVPVRERSNEECRCVSQCFLKISNVA